ncbi:MAG: polysaccharide deacetylase family protein [Defluviitaleaceae bacterium]|nr:polysaccharide deacetylase family protein [Defluviitaleaceae bacterium]
MKMRIFLAALAAIILLSHVSVAASPLETLMGLAMGDTAEVPIIMYHALEDTPDNRWEITLQEFEDDLKYLAEKGYTSVVMQDLIDFVHNGKPLPEKPIVLSFDDGRMPTANIILPLLEEYDARITMAIIGRETDHYTELDKNGASSRHPHMTWDQVRTAHETGRVEIQSHTYNLHGPNGAKKKKGESVDAYRQRLMADLQKFAEKLHENVGITPNSLAYPLGAISSTSDDIIKEAGYLASLSCYEKNNTITVGDADSLYSLNRFLRPPHKSSGEFFAVLNDNKMMNEDND